MSILNMFNPKFLNTGRCNFDGKTSFQETARESRNKNSEQNEFHLIGRAGYLQFVVFNKLLERAGISA